MREDFETRETRAALRRLVVNLLRVTGGAGEPTAIIRLMREFSEAFAIAPLTPDQMADELLVRRWGEREGERVFADNQHTRRDDGMNNIIVGALRLVAARLAPAASQASAARRLIDAGLTELDVAERMRAGLIEEET